MGRKRLLETVRATARTTSIPGARTERMRHRLIVGRMDQPDSLIW